MIVSIHCEKHGSAMPSAHALHLLQSCLVYVNMLVLQRALIEPTWLARLTPICSRCSLFPGWSSSVINRTDDTDATGPGKDRCISSADQS